MIRNVWAVAVAWNQRADIERLVHAIPSAGHADLHLLVVDNASTDGTAEALAAFAPNVTVLRLPMNQGGAGGFNAGMRAALAAGAEAIWLLDGDACPAPQALPPLLAVLEAEPRTVMVGSRIIMDGPPGLVQECGGRITVQGHLAPNHRLADPQAVLADGPVDYVAACSVLVRSSALTDIGLMDGRFFVFFDDIEWCCRARTLGWTIRTAADSRVFHRFNAGKADTPQRVYYLWRNALLWQSWCRPGRLALWRKAIDLHIQIRLWRQAGRPALARAARQGIVDALRLRLGRRDLDAAPAPDAPDPGPLPAGAILVLAVGRHADAIGCLLWCVAHLTDRQVTLVCEPEIRRLGGAPAEWTFISWEPSALGSIEARLHQQGFSAVIVAENQIPLAAIHGPRWCWNGHRLIPGVRPPTRCGRWSRRLMAVFRATWDCCRLLAAHRPDAWEQRDRHQP